jgi:hypothetical protein|tara:strand:- start:518 stop:1066 length:549 start_codon:yes stop_codon:yes gene_type:complete
MSNARKLANLLGTSTTVPSSKLSLVTSDLPAGSILQVQNVEFTQRHHINTNSRTGLSGQYAVSITPTSSSNKILVQTNINCIVYNTNGVRAVLVRNPSGGSAVDASQLGWYNNGATWKPLNTNFCHLDSPATTSAVTYYVEWRIETGGGSPGGIYVNYANTNAGFTTMNDSRATITVMEVAV